MKGCLPKPFLTCKCAKRKKRGWLGSISFLERLIGFFRDGLETSRPHAQQIPSSVDNGQIFVSKESAAGRKLQIDRHSRTKQFDVYPFFPKIARRFYHFCQIPLVNIVRVPKINFIHHHLHVRVAAKVLFRTIKLKSSLREIFSVGHIPSFLVKWRKK